MKQVLTTPKLLIEPSQSLCEFIKRIDPVQLSNNLLNIQLNKKTETKPESYVQLESFLTSQDVKCLNKIGDLKNIPIDDNSEHDDYVSNFQLLTLEDISIAYNIIEQDSNPKIYLHELLKDCKILLPKNEHVKRNSKLEKTCKILRNRLANLEYNKMTENVDCFRRQEPTDTIAFQLREINCQFILIFQVIFSVLATFAFGMFGIQFILGEMSWISSIESRLILSLIMCLIVVVAELYFILKYAQKTIEIEEEIERENQSKARIHSSIQTVRFRTKDHIKK